MRKVTRNDLLSLEQYSQQRAAIRQQVMQHKSARRVALGPHATLYFEDYTTIHYQIQEMLRAERIFESAGIEDELQAYNPLIPDGRNWKATFMIEYEDVAERRVALERMVGIESRVWAQVSGYDRIWAIADEDLERSTDEKTSAVHFLRLELTPAMIQALRGGAALGMGIDHENYSHTLSPLPATIARSLTNDLD